VAVDEQRRRDDLYDVKLRPHDVRAEIGGWTYYVRGVRSKREFLPRMTPVIGELLVDVPLLIAAGLERLISRRRGWTVGVVRMGSVKTWNDVRPVVVHQETLPPRQDPGPRIAELLLEVEAGSYAAER
jgi:hypothetical protein